MMKRTTLLKYQVAAIGFLIAISTGACEKYLNEPSDGSLAVITTLDDLQALLDYNTIMNVIPVAHEVSADNYYLTDDGWESLELETDRRMYIWAEDNVFPPGEERNNWFTIYQPVYYANTVLEHLQELGFNRDNEQKWRDIKGQALMYRAVCFLDAVQIWGPAYDAATAETDPGIPLRLQADFSIPSSRSNIRQTYEQIIADLRESVLLLPDSPLAKTRPSKPAAYGLLARTYLWMRDYPNALRYADSCLMVASNLMDYNDLNPSADFPVPRHNPEIVFERWNSLGQVLLPQRAKIPSSIYQLFDEDDLRKKVFFREEDDGRVVFKGYYLGFGGIESGVATDEMYLTRAECYARDNRIDEAMQDLNILLKKRWSKDGFTPVSASSSNEAVALVLEERRKQLLFRGHRWMDIKRLNKEGANISLTRTLNGQVYTLPANSRRFALPLPDDLLHYFR